MKILITAFKPFGIGKLFNRNESEEIALKLLLDYQADVLILPVDKSCINSLRQKIRKFKPNLIFGLGQADSLRIESSAFQKKLLHSHLAEKIKQKFKTEENIGEYYCNDVYAEEMRLCKNSVFVHIPLFCKYEKIKKIFEFTIKNVK